MNLHHLRVFFTVVERDGFTRAAESLHISQPAVSKAVRELEQQLDLPLIEREPAAKIGAAGVHLTESGQALFEHARGIFALEKAAVEEIRARVGRKRGLLTVGASTTVAGYWLPPYLAQFLQRHDGVRLCLRVGNTQAICRALVDCEIDVGLVEGAVQEPRIEAVHWCDDELSLIAPGAATLARRRSPRVEELAAQTWILRETGSGTRAVAEQVLATLGITPQRTVELGSNESIAQAVAAGAGLAVVPLRVVRELRKLGTVRTVPSPVPVSLLRPLFRLQLRERPQSPLARAFCETLQGNPMAKRRAEPS